MWGFVTKLATKAAPNLMSKWGARAAMEAVDVGEGVAVQAASKSPWAVNAGVQAAETAGKELTSVRGVVGAGKEIAETAGTKVGDAWRATPGIVKVGGGAVGAVEGTKAWFGSTTIGKLLNNSGKILPLALGAAAAGGLLLIFKNKLFGAHEESEQIPEAMPQQAMSQARAPEDMLAQAQTQNPIAAGSTVVASHPAGVVDIAPVMAQEASAAGATDWQERVGGSKASGSFLAAEQARAQAAASRQNTVA